MGSSAKGALIGDIFNEGGGVVGKIINGPKQAEVPDYAALADQTAANNLAAAQYATIANRSNQYNPYGSVTWQQGATKNDPWTQTTSFTPEGQKQFDLQNSLQTKYGETANMGFDKVRGLFENPNIDESKLTAMPMNAGVNSQAAIMSRLRPTLEQEQQALEASLANKGIGIGSTAYSRSQQLQSQRMNDLELQAARQGIELDMRARQQGLEEQYQAMQNPLNLLNSLRTGSQVQAPQFSDYAKQGQTAGADMNRVGDAQYGASLDAANAQNAQTNAMMGGLFSLGTAGMMGANPMMARRGMYGV
jgi:hypothetical protein